MTKQKILFLFAFQVITNSLLSQVSPKVVTGINNSFVLKEDGTLWGWGANFESNLGIGSRIPIEKPMQLGTNTWLNISSSSSGLHTMGLAADGTCGYGETIGCAIG